MALRSKKSSLLPYRFFHSTLQSFSFCEIGRALMNCQHLKHPNEFIILGNRLCYDPPWQVPGIPSPRKPQTLEHVGTGKAMW